MSAPWYGLLAGGQDHGHAKGLCGLGKEDHVPKGEIRRNGFGELQSADLVVNQHKCAGFRFEPVHSRAF